MAPEFVESKIFQCESDIYSFGIFLYEVFCEDFSIKNKLSSPFGDLQGI